MPRLLALRIPKSPFSWLEVSEATSSLGAPSSRPTPSAAAVNAARRRLGQLAPLCVETQESRVEPELRLAPETVVDAGENDDEA